MWRQHIEEGMEVEAYFNERGIITWRRVRVVKITNCCLHGAYYDEVDVQLCGDRPGARTYRRRPKQLRRIQPGATGDRT